MLVGVSNETPKENEVENANKISNDEPLSGTFPHYETLSRSKISMKSSI